VPVGERILVYDAKENVASVSFRGVHLKTTAEVDTHFDDLIRLWRQRCGGKKVYWVVDYADYSVDVRENESYTRNMKRIIDDTAVAIVRYGGTELQHAAVHLYSLRLHKTSHIYATREEALAVLDRLKKGTLKQAL
jgi:hypothetical protein